MTPNRVQVGQPTGVCPACDQRFRMVLPELAEYPNAWALPSHTGDGLGWWGKCSGPGLIARGELEVEDVR